jgi:hypothetical protein
MISQGSFEVLGGVRNFSKLTSQINPILYEWFKAMAWLHMVKQRMAPVAWYKPTGKGTRVKFEMIRNKEELDAQLTALREFCKELPPLEALLNENGAV